MLKVLCAAIIAVIVTAAFSASAETAAEVRMINYKLARYVHPTGKCGVGQEVMTTYYWSGQRVASGGRFNPHGLTAAHRTLPFGTVLNVTNPRNGRSVSVTINDRGPFTLANLDLSLGAAKAIGMDTSLYLCVEGIGSGNVRMASNGAMPTITTRHHHRVRHRHRATQYTYAMPDRTRPE